MTLNLTTGPRPPSSRPGTDLATRTTVVIDGQLAEPVDQLTGPAYRSAAAGALVLAAAVTALITTDHDPGHPAGLLLFALAALAAGMLIGGVAAATGPYRRTR